MLYLYRSVTNSLVDMGKTQANITVADVVSTSAREWYKQKYFLFSLSSLFFSSTIVLHSLTTPATQNRLMIQFKKL